MELKVSQMTKRELQSAIVYGVFVGVIGAGFVSGAVLFMLMQFLR